MRVVQWKEQVNGTRRGRHRFGFGCAMEQALTNRTGTAGQGKREEEGEKGKRVEKGELTAGGGEERIRQASLRQGMAQR
eukprot:scaffold79414_cov30-Tisochrysis_lutea.AAC.7